MRVEPPVAGSESDLVARACAGDALAWRMLVRTHQEPVFRLALLLTGNRADAADVAQDTFIRASRHLSRFEEGKPLRPWLLRIASRQAGNLRRSASRYVRALLKYSPERPSEQPGDWQPAGALWPAVGRLSDGARQVVYLRYFLGLSESETAVVLGVPAGTVKSRHARALKRLEDIIVNDFPELMPEGGFDD